MERKLDWVKVRLMAYLYGRSMVMMFVVFPLMFVVANVAYVSEQLRHGSHMVNVARDD